MTAKVKNTKGHGGSRQWLKQRNLMRRGYSLGVWHEKRGRKSNTRKLHKNWGI